MKPEIAVHIVDFRRNPFRRMPSIRGKAPFKSAESGPELYGMTKKRSEIIPFSDMCFGESTGHMQGSRRYILN
jgi:hypothetical protein